MDPAAEIERLVAKLEAAREREALLREQIGVLQATVQVLREELSAVRAEQRETREAEKDMRHLLASAVHGALSGRLLSSSGERERQGVVEAEIVRDVEPESRSGVSRPEPPRRGGPTRNQPPTRTWRDALWSR